MEEARIVQKKLHDHWGEADRLEAKKISMKHESQQRMEEARDSFLKAKRKRESLEGELSTLEKQILSLKEECDEVEEKLRKRETDLYKYRFKIKDLNKSKQVLTHRTYEMRANLQPKDA